VTVAVASLATGFAVDGLIGAGALPESALVPAATSMVAQGAHAHHEGEGAMSWFETASALVLLAVLINALRPRRPKDGAESMAKSDEQVLELKVNGMHCNGCVTSVQRALLEMSGVTDAEVRLDEGRALIRGKGFSVQELVDAVASLGFEAHS
jgi:copper chaperone CopZ